MILHDLHCTSCSWEEADRAVRGGQFPACPKCGSETTWTPAKLYTDCFGTPQWNEGVGEYVSSNRDALRRLREKSYPALERRGFRIGDIDQAGDRVGGAREEPWSGARHKQVAPTPRGAIGRR